MEKGTKIWLGITLGILVLVVVFQTLQISALNSLVSLTGNAVSTTAPSSGGMVGGC